MTMLAAKNLVCVRGHNLVFEGLDLSLGAGEALMLTGPNGSGKSSLLRVLAGLIDPFDGVISWDGENVENDRAAHRERTSYVGHLDAVKPTLTVRENLAFWAAMGDGENTGKTLHRERTATALAAFGLDGLRDRRGRLLSSGQKRRLNLARLLVENSTLWLLDEPTVGLDVASVKVLEERMAEHRANGGLIIASSHTALDLGAVKHLDMADFSPTEFDHLEHHPGEHVSDTPAHSVTEGAP